VIDIDETLTRGGRERIDLLRYCVISQQMEPLFLFLATEYRLRPAHAAALALFDMFVAADAPARLAAYELLPPRELALGAEVAKIRERWTAMQAPAQPSDAEADGDVRTSPSWPPRMLFDTLVQGIRSDARGNLVALSGAYDPQLTPEQNLPGGKMSATHRQFVERVWQPIVRPRLTSAGFWQVGTIT
jgi:hypothetical protein